MDRPKTTVCWGKKKSRQKEEENELQEILPSEPQQPKDRFSKFSGWLMKVPRKRKPDTAIHQKETPKDFQKLVQNGQFLEACQSISELSQEGQDCGLQYKDVADSMWQVIKEALGGIGYSQKLELKLQAVVATVEWVEDNPQSWEASALEDGGVAFWGSHLERLLRTDAEDQLPTMKPSTQLRPYLKELDKAVGHSLGSQRAARMGDPLWEIYRTCFQEVLLSRLSELPSSYSHDREAYFELYNWGKTTLFGQLGREMLQRVGPTSQKSMAGNLLDSMMFITWMFQMQEKLVGLIQEELKKCLENVLICDQKKWTESASSVFLEIYQLLKEAVDAVRHIGPSVTRRVQAMVLETFSKFLESYKDKAEVFIQQNASDHTFPELHVLENCCILRKTWWWLSRAHVPWARLDPAVQGAIKVIEDHGRDHLLPRVRALCQSLLSCHFGEKNKDLVQSLRSLWQSLEHCHNMHPTPTYESLVRSLNMVVFGEYVQALAAYLRRLVPRTSGHLRAQVETDIWKLGTTFREHRGPALDDLQEYILQLSESRDRQTVDQWLASFSDSFPGYLSRQGRSTAVEEETAIRGRSSFCCRLLQNLRACWHRCCPSRRGCEL
ncbi:uncharacterized protein LOC124231160 [Equus quagga]|uniref:uncharacterized protein LOC124231160 n=1 Tax=Equus quagga TaxID=89248 RepID=UPI001EE2B6F1|nr:uncharacterized protein LOC124231160 [Equus quagga]XP_046503863.1 uncharacterized protein LOC124231160 [Equus quagga]